MNLKKNKASLLLAIALVASLIISGTALAFVYYSMKINMAWRVQTSYGLELWNSGKTMKITSIDWGTIPRGGLATANFIVKNTGNNASIVSLDVTGNYYGVWNVSDSFNDYQYIPKDGWSLPFNITIKDYNANAAVAYTGILNFTITS